jgi:hypothetical protein
VPHTKFLTAPRAVRVDDSSRLIGRVNDSSALGDRRSTRWDAYDRSGGCPVRQPFHFRSTTELEALMDHLVTMTTHSPAEAREHSARESVHG